MKKYGIGLGLGLLIVVGVRFGNDVCRRLENPAPSRSSGSRHNGRLQNGKRLPTVGPNFRTYSYLGSALGRTSVNDKVRAVMLQAYRDTAVELPQTRFVFGETGWPWGGRLRPHRTHQNGLSVDFMVPVLNKSGRPVWLPASVFNTWGYGLEFNEQGAYRDYRIDFNALAAHLYFLNQAALKNGLRVQRVIFDPPLHHWLFQTPYGKKIQGSLPFTKGSVWIRHDEHYHVDFTE